MCRVLDGHEIVSQQDPREALEFLRHDSNFDVIFCDLMMPNMTGMDLYDELLRERAEVARRVVFMTGGAVFEKAAAFLDAVPNLHCISRNRSK